MGCRVVGFVFVCVLREVYFVKIMSCQCEFSVISDDYVAVVWRTAAVELDGDGIWSSRDPEAWRVVAVSVARAWPR